MGGYLTREAILAATSLPTEEVAVPEWGGTVVVRAMDGVTRDEWESSTLARQGNVMVRNTVNIRAKLVALCVIDPETGERLFAPEDVDVLGKLSGAALARVFGVAARLGGLTDEDVEELEGNSSAPTGGGSPSS